MGPEGATGPQGPAGPQGPSGPQGPYDKVVRLPFFTAGVGWVWDQSEPFALPARTYIVKFNKQHYVGVDSIIFVATLSSSTSSSRAAADLYNHTDGMVVTRSEVQTASTSAVWVESGNIFGSLPDKEVTLGIRIRTETAGARALLETGYLVLYRR